MFSRADFVRSLCCAFVLCCSAGLTAHGQAAGAQYPKSLLGGLQWRDVGPMRGGRAYAVAGNARQPDTFYMGSVGGGLWKTENDGRTWKPIADQGIPIGSIGAIAVAPSDPNVVYVGTGEPDIRSQISYGIGMFKSVDAGRTWKSIGLRDSRQIGKIVIDPHDPNRVYVAALGHVYDANSERGVFRSEDGGEHWKKVLFSAQNPAGVGAIDLALDPKDSRTIYASLWATRRPPWAVYAPANLPGGGLFKSVDGGDTWKQLGGGLPTDATVGKIGIAVAPSDPKRLWAVVDDLGSPVAPPLHMPGTPAPPEPKVKPPTPPGGVYVSSDAGATWTKVNSEVRLWGRGWYFEQVTVDPRNSDRAFVINTATYLTEDGGKTFRPVKGAPGGDDYHQLWINPVVPSHMVLSSDQGTVVSVDGGVTWSTWYNQPTAQIYHIAASNGFPYWLYGAQQDSGAVGVETWSRFGVLDDRNWEPACLAGESNTVVADPEPKDGKILYGGGKRCDQALNVMIPTGKLPEADPSDPERRTWSLPTVFSKADQALYYSDQFVFRSRDRAKTWQKISPDLSRVSPATPGNLDAISATDVDQGMKTRFGVVYTISPSPLSAQTVWAGTDDGLIHVTTDDGANWKDVTPRALSAWSKISQLEAGHFDAGTAYASVDRHRLGDNRAYIYRTHDGGRSWTEIARGIPDGAYVNSVKEDPRQKGLLYAATELRVYVSFDDGGYWQPLQGNMPVTSVRDIVVHGDDLAVATYGRGFWVMDHMEALREIAAKGQQIAGAEAYLFAPGETLAIHNGGQDGTPLPHEEPQGKNPPPGVLAYYWLKSAPAGPLKLELLDADGEVRACAASDTPVNPVDTEAIDVEAIWRLPAAPPSAAAGMHRFSLNVPTERNFGPGGSHAPPPPPADLCHPAGTPPAKVETGKKPEERQEGLQPGRYTVRLTVEGKTYTQPVVLKPDPRNVPAGAAIPEDDDNDR